MATSTDTPTPPSNSSGTTPEATGTLLQCDHPNATDWKNRCERAEAECAELRAILTLDMQDHLAKHAAMIGKSPGEVMSHMIDRLVFGLPPSPTEEAALVILRRDALAQSVAIAKQGEDVWSVTQRAECLLKFTLGSR